jgi:Cdc6-like AAA superfamily ATPase
VKFEDFYFTLASHLEIRRKSYRNKENKVIAAMTTDQYALFEQARKQSPNPFSLGTVIADTEIWGEVITNLSSLNQNIDQKIEQAISEVRQKYSSKIGIAIKGDRGTGKSHAIHRVWKKIETEGGAVFAYIPPCDAPNRIESHVRFYLSQSFTHQDVHGATQWQKMAATAITTLKGTEYQEKYREYLEKSTNIEQLSKFIKSNVSKTDLLDFFDELAESILENQPELDFNFLKAILLSLLKNTKQARIALCWIQGDGNLDTSEVGLPKFSATQHENKSLWAIQQICKLAKVASMPVLICFDQLDSVEPDIESGDSPAQRIARCIDRIYSQCNNVIILCCVISDTWREIQQMGSGIPDRVGQRSVTAIPPNAEQMIEIVRLRLNYFYKNNSLNLSDYPPLYPFNEDQIKKIASEGAGVRSLLEECAKKFEFNKPIDSEGIDPKGKNKEKLQNIYNELLSKVSIPINDDAKLASIISSTIKMIPDGGTENVVVNRVEPFRASSHDLHLIIYGYDTLQNQEVRIGVRVCETNQYRTFNAVMDRLLKYEKHNITRGCLVRSTPLPKSWKSSNQLKEKLESQKGGEVVDNFKKDDIKSLVVLETIYSQAENYGFDKQEIINLIKELKLASDNYLLCEILSAPIIK